MRSIMFRFWFWKRIKVQFRIKIQVFVLLHRMYRINFHVLEQIIQSISNNATAFVNSASTFKTVLFGKEIIFSWPNEFQEFVKISKHWLFLQSRFDCPKVLYHRMNSIRTKQFIVDFHFLI